MRFCSIFCVSPMVATISGASCGERPQTTVRSASGAFTTLQDQTNHVYKSVIIKADPKADYGTVLQVMDAAKNADLTNFGLANKVEKK